MTTLATWTIQLIARCPGCDEMVDLLEHPNFWKDKDFLLGENGSPRTRRVEVVCPDCEHEFKVTLDR